MMDSEPTTVTIANVNDDDDSSFIETGRSLPRQETTKRSQRNLFGVFQSSESDFLIQEEKDNYIDQKTIQVLDENEARPMNRHRRKLTEGVNFVNDIFEDVKDIFDGDSSSSDESVKLPPKYRIDTFRKQKNTTLLDKVQRFLDGNNESGILIPYLHWSFNASFFTLFISMLINFMVLVLIFTGFIVLAATLKPTCITPNSGTHFADAFALSWMTFTTVGFGNIYPSLASQESEVGHCTFITFLTSMEAFVGVLYAGFCGAIIFGKVLRIQSQAQISFSDIIVITFGEGKGTNFLHTIQSMKNDETIEGSKLPCPILEFRIINKLYPKRNCEIIDATLNCVLEIKSKHKNDVHPYYAPLELRMSTHPLFSSKWHARHVIDENSPILRPHVRKLIKKNDGHWPKDLNSYSGVKESLIDFEKLFVSFSGTSNISASAVFAQKEYGKFHMFTGYEFVSIEYKSAKNQQLLDTEMINDVMEQQGGGGEPLFSK